MKDFIGEMLGTFVLTLMGCCSVAVAVAGMAIVLRVM